MAKAKPHPDQMALPLTEPRASTAPAALAGLDARISRSVGTILASCGRPREVIAAEMSVLLDDEISRAMLDAYSSPARSDHRVPMSRYFALVAVTARLDLMNPLLGEIGGSILIGPEVQTARIGQLELMIAEAARELRALKNTAPMIRGGGIK